MGQNVNLDKRQKVWFLWAKKRRTKQIFQSQIFRLPGRWQSTTTTISAGRKKRKKPGKKTCVWSSEIRTARLWGQRRIMVAKLWLAATVVFGVCHGGKIPQAAAVKKSEVNFISQHNAFLDWYNDESGLWGLSITDASASSTDEEPGVVPPKPSAATTPSPVKAPSTPKVPQRGSQASGK